MASELSPLEKKLLENLQQHYHQLATEAKKKHPQLKEAAESGIVKLRAASFRKHNLKGTLMAESGELLEPFFMGCDTKQTKIVQISLNAIQRLITFDAISNSAANNLVNCLWNLMEGAVEELKLLQTVTLLISSNRTVEGDTLAKAISLCFRLHFTKNSTTNNTASATIRQLVSVIFERVQSEDQTPGESSESIDIKLEDLKAGRYAPKTLRPSAADAFLLFQDLIQLVNADQPFWLTGLTEMTRTFGLELLELIFTSFPEIFYKHQEFGFLLKERVCQLVIKLFSPNIKQRPGMTSPISMPAQQSGASPQPSDKPFWPITVRLMRIVSILIQKFYTMLITESEIFLSLVVKSLESDKPNWQRCIALEALHKMVQPNFISSLCRFYDMKPHSSKIFHDIVNALCIYTQSQFLYVDSSSTQSLIASIVNNQNVLNSVNSGNIQTLTPITPQPAFMLRGIWNPILFNLPKGTYKPYFIEQLDKLEAPSAPEGHGITSAFSCILEIVNSVTSVIENDDNKTVSEHIEYVKNLDEETRSLHENLLSASWCGLLGTFALLLDASTDETITELILKTMQKLAGLYGIYGLHSARDAVLTSICKSSLPPNYSLPVLNMVLPNETVEKQNQSHHLRQTSVDITNNINIANLLSQQNSLQTTNSSSYMNSNESSETRQQVVAVGTPLPSVSLPQSVQQGPVMLTSKNLQCMNAILSVAFSHGSVFEEKSWHIILTTLQHLVWILGLKPTTGGSLKVGRAGTEAGASTNALITTAAMSDLPVLSAMLSRLFESSQNLLPESLLHLVNALIKLSHESMEIALNNREPSLFAVAKLLETGIVNKNRIEIIWKPITGHLLEVCQHPHIKMREWGVEALCSLVKSVLSNSQSEEKLSIENSESMNSPESTNAIKTKQFLYFAPLQDLSYISHSDIRQKQLDCALQILQSNGDTLSHGWPQMFEIIGAINDSQSENLIRCAFQCLQLIISDFLTLIPPLCLILCVDTTAKFGSQNQELNVSLTAIGLLWNIADHLHSNRESIKSALNSENLNVIDSDNQFNSQLSAFDCLWMGLFTRLGESCTDSRASVRKSAGQTLFSTLGTHGTIIEPKTWHSVLWSVLFPLLDRVRVLSGLASSDKITDNKSNSGNILLHHSRNTEQKQWSETQVLVLSGVCRTFAIKRDALLVIDDFYKCWTILLDQIETSALSQNSEVSLSALKCFQELFCTTKIANNENDNEIVKLWSAAWKVWYNIGIMTTELNVSPEETIISDLTNKNLDNCSLYIPSQAFLTALIQIFPYLFVHIKSKFSEGDFAKLSSVLQNAVSVPLLNSDVSASYVLSSQNESLTQLQECVLHVMETLQKDILHDHDLFSLLPSVFNLLLAFSCYSVNVAPSLLEKIIVSPQNTSNINKYASMNANLFYPFGERCLKHALAMYQQTANTSIVIESRILHTIIKTLKIQLCIKYSCPSQSTWKLAINCLLSVLQIGIPVARQNPSDFVSIWGDLALALDGFLFPISKPPVNQTLEEQQYDESLDVKVIELIRDCIMPYAGQIPKEFLLQTVSLLNKGSIHSATNSSPIDTDSTRKLREEFARVCFETLLQFSFLGPKGTHGLFIQTTMGTDFTPDHSIGIVNKLAVTSILQRFNDVVVKYVEDEKLCPCPLPRHRMAEISFVLKALSTLIASLKKAPAECVEPIVWELLIGLYPHLVDCTISNSIQVNRSLREVLFEYAELISPPSKSVKSLQNGC